MAGCRSNTRGREKWESRAGGDMAGSEHIPQDCVLLHVYRVALMAGGVDGWVPWQASLGLSRHASDDTRRVHALLPLLPICGSIVALQVVPLAW